jgi:hypothetical protein
MPGCNLQPGFGLDLCFALHHTPRARSVLMPGRLLILDVLNLKLDPLTKVTAVTETGWGSTRYGFQRDMYSLQRPLHAAQFRAAKPRTWVRHYGGAGSDLAHACGDQKSPASAGLFLQRIEPIDQ